MTCCINSAWVHAGHETTPRAHLDVALYHHTFIRSPVLSASHNKNSQGACGHGRSLRTLNHHNVMVEKLFTLLRGVTLY
jgi:hypothetical protein